MVRDNLPSPGVRLFTDIPQAKGVFERQCCNNAEQPRQPLHGCAHQSNIRKTLSTGYSTKVLPTLKQKQERSMRRLGQSLGNTETHKRKSQFRPNRLRSSDSRFPAAIKHTLQTARLVDLYRKSAGCSRYMMEIWKSQEDVESNGEISNERWKTYHLTGWHHEAVSFSNLMPG